MFWNGKDDMTVLGYDLFVCPHCGNESIVPHKCHSKLCTSCGTKEAKLRAAHIASIIKRADIVDVVIKDIGKRFLAFDFINMIKIV